MLSGQSKEAFGFGQRHPLTKQITSAIRFHINDLSTADLTHHSFERRRSSYPAAKSDIIIYDPEGTPVVRGREFSEGGHSVVFWREDQPSLT